MMKVANRLRYANSVLWWAILTLVSATVCVVCDTPTGEKASAVGGRDLCSLCLYADKRVGVARSAR